MTTYRNNRIKKYRKNITKRIIILILIFITITIFYTNQTNSQTTPHILIEPSNQILKKDEHVELTVHLNNSNIAAYTMYLYYDTSKLEYVSSPENSNHIYNSVVHTGITSTGIGEENIQISPFIFKVISQEGISSIIVTGEFYNQNGEKVEIEDEILELQIGEKAKKIEEQKSERETNEEIQANQNVSADNTNLKILRLDRQGISPSFSPDIKEYYLVISNNINNIEVTAVPENEKATVTITGNQNLKNGLNTIKITVESEDKTKKSEYIINVTKTSDIQKANTNLENLAVNNGTLTPEFDTNVTKYTVELDNDIDKIEILAVPENMSATVEIKKGETLKIGDNQIEVIVTAEDNITKKKYEIIAHRRTTEEEIKYEEEQKQKQETLANILEEKEIQENNERNNKTTNNNEEKNIAIYVIIPVIILSSIVIIIWLIKKKK